MNAQRNDHRDDMSAPHDAVMNLVRATSDAMEALMKTDAKDEKEAGGVSLNPLMTNPAVMMAAATAYGIRMTGQWATLFLNALEEQAARVSEAASAAENAVVETAEPAVEPAEGAVVVEPAVEAAVVQPPKRAQRAPATARPRKPSAANAKAKVASPAVDDLKQISGIGPKLANVLVGRGVATYAALAGMDEAALAALDAELGLEGRILRDDWAGQARKILAARG